MIKNSVLRTIRMSVLSVSFAFLAFSFLTFGVANVQSASAASVGSQTVTISVNQSGQAVFSPNKITVQLGTSLVIVNSTKVTQTVVREGVVVAKLASGAQASVMLDKPGFVQFTLLSNKSATLSVTVTFGG